MRISIYEKCRNCKCFCISLTSDGIDETIVVYLKIFLLQDLRGVLLVRLGKYKNIVIVVLLIVVCVFGRMHILKKSTPVASIRVDEMTPLSLELVYRGEKPAGVGSVQSMAIVGDYFVIAARPTGPKEFGGETNNQLIIVDRETLRDVTDEHLRINATFELGHANGMTYDSLRNRLAVVGIHNDNNEYDGLALVNASYYFEYGQRCLPCFGNGIAYNAEADEYYLRDDDTIRVLDGQLHEVLDEAVVVTDLTNQDICYHDGRLYLVNWAYYRCDARAVGVRTNENVIYQVDVRNNYAVRAFVVREPRQEMESIDFADDGEAYVLFNGGGRERGYFLIYRVVFEERDLE